MNKPKHTPGPWTFFAGDLSDGRVTIVSQGKTRNGQEVTICDTLNDMMGNAEHKANARLIAAAPELLDFVRLVLKATDMGSDGNIGISTRQMLAADAAALIAKATGGAE